MGIRPFPSREHSEVNMNFLRFLIKQPWLWALGLALTCAYAQAQSNFPNGPLTETLEPVTLTSTPPGIAIGFFPMRDMLVYAFASPVTLVRSTRSNRAPHHPIYSYGTLDPS